MRVEIANRIAENPPRLFFLPPLLPGISVVREVFASEEVYAVAQGPWPADQRGHQFARMRGYLDTWTEGLRVSVADDPYKKPKSTFMARLDPVADEFFDIRCIDPYPGIRALGAFADKDLFFIALTWNDRPVLNTDRIWRDEIERTKATWRKLFHPYRPLKGANLHDYASNIRVV
jgi:hypothetical protein